MSNTDKSDLEETGEYSAILPVINISSNNDGDGEIIMETGPATSRKRKRCPELWKRNVDKKAR